MNRCKSSCFGHLLEIEDLKFSGQLAHSILLRQTHKDADEGMQFVIGDTITTFSEQDFALVTGLKCGELPPLEEVPASDVRLKEQYFPGMDEITVADLEKAFKACLDSEDSFRLAMVLFVEGVLNGREVTNNVGTRFLSLVQDFEQFNNYPWGTFSYEHTIHCMNSVLRGRDEAFEKRQSQKEQHNAERYSLKGFPLALQAWTYEIMPDLAKHRFVHKNIGSPPYPRILRWKYPKSHPSYNKLRNVIFGSKKAPEVIPLIPGIEEMQQPYWTWGDNIRATYNHRPKLYKPGAGTKKATYNVPLKQGTLYQNPGEVIHRLSHNNSVLDEIAGIKNLISKEIRGLRREIRTLRNDVCSRGVGSYTSDRQLLLELIKSVRGQGVKVQRRSRRRTHVTKLGGTRKAFMPRKPRQRRVNETYSAIWNSDTPLNKDDVGFENVASQRCNVPDPVVEQLRGKGGATTLTDEDLEQAPNSMHIISSTMELDVSEKLVNCNKAVGKESNAQGTVTTEKDESTAEFEADGNVKTHKGRSLYNVQTAAQPICSALKESLSLRETAERSGEEPFLDGLHLINNTVSGIGAAPEEQDVILDDKLHNPDEAVNNTTFPSTALTSDTSSTMPNQKSGDSDEQCLDGGGKQMHAESDTQTNVPALTINEGDVGIQPDVSFGHLVRDEQQISVEHPGPAVGLIDGPLRRSARIRRPGPQIRTPFAGANPNKKRKAGDYNPFAPAPKHAKNELANFINRWSQSPNDTINVCGEVVDQRFILDVVEVGAHLSSLHMDMGLSLLRHRQSEYPSVFGTRWTSVDCFFHQMLIGTGGFPAFSKFEDSSMWKPDDRMIQYVLGRRPNWSRRWDSLDLVFIPVNLSEVHWVTASADLVSCKITVYDSKMTLHTSGQINEIFKPLSHLVPHLLDTAGFLKNTADHDGYLRPWPVCRAEHVPQQTTDDCGLFCLKTVDCLSSGFPLKQWTQNEIQEFRMKLAIEFMHGASYV